MTETSQNTNHSSRELMLSSISLHPLNHHQSYSSSAANCSRLSTPGSTLKIDSGRRNP